MTSLSKKELRTTIAIILKRNYPCTEEDQWLDIPYHMLKSFKCELQLIQCMLEKLVEVVGANPCRPGAGKKRHILMGLENV